MALAPISTPVFVIEDDDAVRDAIVRCLRDNRFQARGFASGEAFLDRLPPDQFACLVVDLNLSGIDGFELLDRLAEITGRTWLVVIITGFGEVRSAVRLMKAGAVDFLEKPLDPEQLLDSVAICANRLADLRRRTLSRDTVERLLARLTASERQVLDGLVEGRTNKEIGIELEISPRTVEIFRGNILQKMQTDRLPVLVRMLLAARQTV